jgi:hypothetical protein
LRRKPGKRGNLRLHEGRRHWREQVNVGNSAFHEGRGAGKTDPEGGHDLVNGKKIVYRKVLYARKCSLKKCFVGGTGPASEENYLEASCVLRR